jgi:hypothetical protein
VNTFKDLFVDPTASGGYPKSHTSPFDYLLAKYPLLEVKLIDAWTKEDLVATDSPPIAYYASDGDPASYHTYVGEDKWTDVDAEEVPTDLHLFVGLNDKLFFFEDEQFRTLFEGKSLCTLEPMHRDERGGHVDQGDYYDSDCFDPSPPSGGGSPNPPSSGSGGVIPKSFDCFDTSDRHFNDNRDNFFQLRFKSKKQLDDAFEKDNGWGDRSIEVRFTVLFGASVNSVSQVSKVLDIKKGHLRRNPLFGSYELLNFTADEDIVTWRIENQVVNMTYIFSEIDSEESGKRTFSGSAEFQDPKNPKNVIKSSYSVEIPFGGEDLGQHIVEYCDDTAGEGTEYSTARLFFRVRQK